MLDRRSSALIVLAPGAIAILIVGLGTGACYTPSMPDRAEVVAQLSSDLGSPGGAVEDASESIWSDGLSEIEVMGAALGDHPEWMATLLQLDVGQMDLLQAGKIRNPVVQLLLPVGSKQFEGKITSALSDIWLRRSRVRAAELDGRVMAERIMSTGLQRVTAARLAFHRARYAHERSALMAERVALESERLALIERAIELGELGGLELAAARIDAATVDALSVQVEADASMQWTTLLAFVGEDARAHAPDFDEESLKANAPPPASGLVADELVGKALVSRHEVRGATLEAAAAARRAGLARKDFMAMSVIADANDIGGSGFEIGPGLLLEVPIFDWGDVRRGRAAADLTLRLALQRSVAFTVRAQVTQRLEQLQSQELLVATAERQLDGVRARLELAYSSRQAAGEASELDRLTFQGEVFAARDRVLTAQLARATATVDLESALGFRIRSTQTP